MDLWRCTVWANSLLVMWHSRCRTSNSALTSSGSSLTLPRFGIGNESARCSAGPTGGGRGCGFPNNGASSAAQQDVTVEWICDLAFPRALASALPAPLHQRVAMDARWSQGPGIPVVAIPIAPILGLGEGTAVSRPRTQGLGFVAGMPGPFSDAKGMAPHTRVPLPAFDPPNNPNGAAPWEKHDPKWGAGGVSRKVTHETPPNTGPPRAQPAWLKFSAITLHFGGYFEVSISHLPTFRLPDCPYETDTFFFLVSRIWRSPNAPANCACDGVS